MSDQTSLDAGAVPGAAPAEPGQAGAAIPPSDPRTADGEARPDAVQTGPSSQGLEAVYDIPVNITAVIGRTHLEVSDLLALGEGDVIELDRKVGEAIDIYVNNRLIARGEVVLVDDALGVTMTEIIKSERNE